MVEAAGAGAHIFSRPFESADGAIEEYLPSAGTGIIGLIGGGFARKTSRLDPA